MTPRTPNKAELTVTDERLSDTRLGLNLHVRVSDTRGEPLPGVPFQVHMSNQELIRSITDETGSYLGRRVVELASGTKAQVFLVLEGSPVTDWETVPVEVKASLPPAQITMVLPEPEFFNSVEFERARRTGIERRNERILQLRVDPRIMALERDLKRHEGGREGLDFEYKRDNLAASLVQRNPLTGKLYLDDLKELASGKVQLLYEGESGFDRGEDGQDELLYGEFRGGNLIMYDTSFGPREGLKESNYFEARKALSDKGLSMPTEDEMMNILARVRPEYGRAFFWIEGGRAPVKAPAVRLKRDNMCDGNHEIKGKWVSNYRACGNNYEFITVEPKKKTTGFFETSLGARGVLRVPIIDAADLDMAVVKASYEELPHPKPDWQYLRDYFAQFNTVSGRSYAESLSEFPLNQEGRIEVWVVNQTVMKVGPVRVNGKEWMNVPINKDGVKARES